MPGRRLRSPVKTPQPPRPSFLPRSGMILPLPVTQGGGIDRWHGTSWFGVMFLFRSRRCLPAPFPGLPDERQRARTAQPEAPYRPVIQPGSICTAQVCRTLSKPVSTSPQQQHPAQQAFAEIRAVHGRGVPASDRPARQQPGRQQDRRRSHAKHQHHQKGKAHLLTHGCQPDRRAQGVAQGSQTTPSNTPTLT